MKLLTKSKDESHCLKMSVYGFGGSGKTFTAALYMIGLHKFAGSDRPVAFFDTEKSAFFVEPLFEQAGIEFVSHKARDLKSLNAVMKEAEQECFGLIIDSITHVYKELCSAYIKNKKGVTFIELRDWQPIKSTWQDYFTTPFVNSNLHIISCARAKTLFADVLDELASSKMNREIFKNQMVGIGARNESESEHEASINMEMSQVIANPNDKSGEIYISTLVKKERWNLINGERFNYYTVDSDCAIKENKPFMDILPHVKKLNLAGEHINMDLDASSCLLFDDAFDDNLALIRRRRTIALEEILNIPASIYPKSGGDDKKMKLDIMAYLFDTTAWTKIKSKTADDLEGAVVKLNALKKASEVSKVSDDLLNIGWVRAALDQGVVDAFVADIKATEDNDFKEEPL